MAQLPTTQQNQRLDPVSTRGFLIDCRQGMLIPNIRDIKNFQLQDVQWILVIEKEVCHSPRTLPHVLTLQATFRTLATNKYWSTSPAGKGTIITVRSPFTRNPHIADISRQKATLTSKPGNSSTSSPFTHPASPSSHS